MFFNVNSRPVSLQDKTVKNIVAAIKAKLSDNRFPFVFLNIKVPPEFIDGKLCLSISLMLLFRKRIENFPHLCPWKKKVNVEPDKTVVFFHQPDLIVDA